jgi:SAM-dependent methyltransferase
MSGIGFKGRGSTPPRITLPKPRNGPRAAHSDTSVHFIKADARKYQVEPGSLDLAICLGATHAFGLGGDAYRNAIRQMVPLLVPGGQLLVADGYLKQPAPPEYRELLGDTIPDEMTHAANVATGQELGLIPLAAWTSSDDEWDEFEWTYQRIIERAAAQRSDDHDAAAKLQRRRDWIGRLPPLGPGHPRLRYVPVQEAGLRRIADAMHFVVVDAPAEAERRAILLTLREHNRQSNAAFLTALDHPTNAARPLKSTCFG